MAIIQTPDLHKHFKQTRAVSGVDIHVQSGEIYGFMGLNGAVKSTTIRMLPGMLRPTRGSVWINDSSFQFSVYSLQFTVVRLTGTQKIDKLYRLVNIYDCRIPGPVREASLLTT